MGNTQSIWILCGVLLTLKFLNANGEMTAAETRWIMEGSVELN